MQIPSAAALCLAATLGACTYQDQENFLTSGTAIIQVQNTTSSTLQKVYTPPCTGGALGPDRLADRGSVPPGGLNTFGLAPGCYDVVGDFEGGARLTVQDVQTFPDVQSRVVFTY
jgi:hypothetical protein